MITECKNGHIRFFNVRKGERPSSFCPYCKETLKRIHKNQLELDLEFELEIEDFNKDSIPESEVTLHRLLQTTEASISITAYGQYKPPFREPHGEVIGPSVEVTQAVWEHSDYQLDVWGYLTEKARERLYTDCLHAWWE